MKKNRKNFQIIYSASFFS
uniref:Uncharacterized protein n=1 Tax=Rhizophora mucronata TaxID=61149 RepID=A0A2P2N1F9_RHIMU